MQVKIKTLLCAVSFVFNGLFALLLIHASLSPSSAFSFPRPGEGCVTAAAAVSFPPGGSAAFGLIEISLPVGGRASLQFSAVSGKNQANFLISPLFDPGIIAVTHTGYGLEITALSRGSALMQSLSNDGVKNVALVTVE